MVLRAHGVWRRHGQEQPGGSWMGVSAVGNAIRPGWGRVGWNFGLGEIAGTMGSGALVNPVRAVARGGCMARGQQGRALN